LLVPVRGTASVATSPNRVARVSLPRNDEVPVPFGRFSSKNEFQLPQSGQRPSHLGEA